MSTLGNIIDRILLTVEGASGNNAIIGSLNANISATANTFPLAGAAFVGTSGFTTGVMEIGTELVYVQELNTETNVAAGVIRGYGGSVAAAHTTGTPVRNNPQYPRYRIAKIVNDIIIGSDIYPAIYSVKTVSVTPNGFNQDYPLPADVGQVTKVRVKDFYNNNSWSNVTNWSFNKDSENTSGKTLSLFTLFSSLTPVRVTYKVIPKKINYTDDFTVSGLPDWVEELVEYGAILKLIKHSEVPKFNDPQNVQNAEQGYSQILNNIKFIYGDYQQLRTDAANRVARENGITVHYNFNGSY